MRRLSLSKSNLAVAFFGTPSYSAYLLEKIITDKELPVEVKLIVTQPDRPVGKKQILTPSPVSLVAHKFQISISNFQTNFQNIDLALVCAYGQILPKELLTIPKYGFWNIHFSLLPKYRGGAPVAYALINGDRETGVTILQMDEKLDHGPIISQEKTAILPNELRPGLEMRLTEITYNILKKMFLILSEDVRLRRLGIPRRTSGRVPTGGQQMNIERKNQKHSDATYAPLLKKQDGFISIDSLKTALKNKQLTHIYNRFRGLYPWPGLWTTITINGREKRLKITNMNQLAILTVQLEGKKAVDFTTFNRAYKVFT